MQQLFSLEDASGTNVSVDGVCWQIKVHTVAIRFSKIKNERNEMKMINGGRGTTCWSEIFVLTNVVT